MKFMTVLVLALKVILAYLQNKKDSKRMRANMLREVDKACQSFAGSVAEGNEDDVSVKINDLLDEIDLRKK